MTQTQTRIRPAGGRGLPRHWPVALGLVIGGLGFADARYETGGTTTLLLPVLALVYLLFGVLRRQWRRPGIITLETAGLLLFALVAAISLIVDPAVGRYLVAAGWLAHAGWDLLHLRREMVVPRWYAKCCIVVDALVAVTLVVS